MESGKLKERTKADLEFEWACSLRCPYSLIRLKLREKQSKYKQKESVGCFGTRRV
jgi:hypothetical protein